MEMRDVIPAPKSPRRFGWLGAVLGMAAVACLGMGRGAALADSGDFAAVVNGATDYILPASSCTALQGQVGIDAELIVACSIGGRPASPGPSDSPCDIVDNTTNAGLAVGQCLTNAFPTPFLPVDPGSGALEANTNIRGAAAGNNLALSDRDQISVTSVGTGGGTVLGLVDVQACDPPGNCPTPRGDPSCNGLPVMASQPIPASSQTTCGLIQARLADSVLTNPPALSHALFFNLEQAGSNGVLKVVVCDGYKWSCRAPGTVVENTSYRGQVPISIVDTPVCVRLARSTRCS